MDGEKGLICAYALNGDGAATPLDWDGVANWKPAHGALWVHLDHADEGSREWIRETSGLDAAVGSILLARETRPRSIDLTPLLALLAGGAFPFRRILRQAQQLCCWVVCL